MPTADATLLLPPPLSDDSDHSLASSARAFGDGGTARHLDHVGVETVLGAMIEQKRRASQPSFPAYREPGASDTESPPSERTGRAPTRSEVFLKAR